MWNNEQFLVLADVASQAEREQCDDEDAVLSSCVHAQTPRSESGGTRPSTTRTFCWLSANLLTNRAVTDASAHAIVSACHVFISHFDATPSDTPCHPKSLIRPFAGSRSLANQLLHQHIWAKLTPCNPSSASPLMNPTSQCKSKKCLKHLN